MRNSIASTIWRFSTTRMLHEYVERLYLPAAAADAPRRRAPTAGTAARPVRAPPTPATGRREAARVAPRISLALAIHNHQPVGNFGWVFAEVYDQAYLPMLEALERHPGVRLSLHYTGPAARVAGAPSGPTFLDAPARARRRATRSRSSAAACTSRSSRRCPSATASAS